MPDRLKETFYVQGMSCTGCETIVEKVLHKLDGVLLVQANFTGNQVTVTYDPAKVNLEKMNAAVKAAGYTMGKEPGPSVPAAVRGKSRTFSTLQFVGVAIILLALYLIISHTIGFNFIPEVTASMGYGVLFVVGLLTSLHCVAMCGGINASQCVNSAGTAGVSSKIKPSLFYNLGRVISYTVIGGIIGAVGSVIRFSGWARGLIAILSGVFMVLVGLSMTGLFPWMNKITPRLPRIFREKTRAAGRSKGPFVVGLLNGLMPCGPLQAMQIYALGTGSALKGALSMFFFSLGTVPLMFGLGAVLTFLGSRFSKKMMKASAVLVAVLGVIMLGRGLVLSGISLPSLLPATTVSAAAAAVSSDISPVVSSDDSAAGVNTEVQNISSTLPVSGYPDIVVQKDVPVVWNLKADAKNINGCNRTMVLPEYGIQVDLKEGDNIIEFTPTKSGTFTYSCWMGMQTGRITVNDGPDQQSSQSAQSSPSGYPDPSLSADAARPSDAAVTADTTAPTDPALPAATDPTAAGPNCTAAGSMSCCA